METTLGKRIAALRRQKGLKQDVLAEQLGISPQAVSKWENDQTCPDISLLPELAKILGVSVDELLSGKSEKAPVVQVVSETKRKDVKDMILRVAVESKDGDTVNVNVPMTLLQIAIESGIEIPQASGNIALNEILNKIDWEQIMTLIHHGAIGNLVEVKSAEGDTVKIFVE